MLGTAFGGLAGQLADRFRHSWLAMQRHEIGSVTLVLVAGLGCGPTPLPAQDGTESSTQGDGDGGDGDGDGDPWCSAELGAEIEPMIVDLQTIVDGTIAYFQIEHPSEDPSLPLHRCPHPEGTPSAGEASYTAEISHNCNEAPECKCDPVMNGGGVGVYDLSLWLQNSVWQGVGFSKTEPHAFHYNLIVYNDLASSYGGCEFIARAISDFDDDALFSTYERRGTIDENGVNLEPLFMDLLGE